MNAAKDSSKPRLLTANEFADYIKFMRICRKWTQETLAELSHLSSRTIQRIERTGIAGFETKRSLASAFGAKDLDVFDKPIIVPSKEEIETALVEFEKEYITLLANHLTSGKELTMIAERCMLNLMHSSLDLSREADEFFAAMSDYFKDYQECHGSYTQFQKLEVYDDFQSYIDNLKTLKISLCVAERELYLKLFGEPYPAKAAYIIAFPLGEEPKEFITARKPEISF